MSKLPDISQLRGMGEPLFFSFNVHNKTPKKLICHGVIFTSFEMCIDDTKIKLCEPADDPRMEHFIQFIAQNYLGKETKDRLSSEISKLATELSELETKIKQMKKELKNT